MKRDDPNISQWQCDDAGLVCPRQIPVTGMQNQPVGGDISMAASVATQGHFPAFLDGIHQLGKDPTVGDGLCRFSLPDKAG